MGAAEGDRRLQHVLRGVAEGRAAEGDAEADIDGVVRIVGVTGLTSPRRVQTRISAGESTILTSSVGSGR